MMTDYEIAQMMNARSLQDGNNDSPWWLLFARDVERATIARAAKICDILTMGGSDNAQAKSAARCARAIRGMLKS